MPLTFFKVVVHAAHSSSASFLCHGNPRYCSASTRRTSALFTSLRSPTDTRNTAKYTLRRKYKKGGQRDWSKACIFSIAFCSSFRQARTLDTATAGFWQSKSEQPRCSTVPEDQANQRHPRQALSGSPRTCMLIGHSLFLFVILHCTGKKQKDERRKPLCWGSMLSLSSSSFIVRTTPKMEKNKVCCCFGNCSYLNSVAFPDC